FLRRFERGERLRIDFLIRTGAVPEAADAARRSRARVLAMLRWIDRVSSLNHEERSRWDAALASYRNETESLAEESKDDWKLSQVEFARVAVARRIRADQARAALDQALVVLGPRDIASNPPLPNQDELFLIYYPASDGWIGFASTKQTTAFSR